MACSVSLLRSGITTGSTPTAGLCAWNVGNPPVSNPLFMDLETHSATDRFRMLPEEFFRVGGVISGDRYGETRDWASMVHAVYDADRVVGHNVVSFDLPALECDVLDLTEQRRVLDTMIVDSLVDPPESELIPSRAMRDKYSLQAASDRYGISGKSGDLKAAAMQHGGFGSIPTCDTEHLRYLRADVEATRDLFVEVEREVSNWDYVWREHRVHALTSNITTVGFDVDQELLEARCAAAHSRQAELVDWLVRVHGVPTVLPNGKPAKSPHASKAGKEALLAAFESVGVPPSALPRTPTGQPSFSADGLAEVADRFPAASDLCEAVAALVGVRSVYGTARRYLHADGRVHADVTMFQASGRASFTKPGMTVFGKKGERVQERDIFVARPGYTIVTADLSQVDARCVAAHSGDPEYAKLFEPGKDSHEITARLVWGDREYERDPKYFRQTAKIIGHGSNYGMGVSKLALSANVPEEEAHRVVRTLREEFPRVEEWKMEVRERAEAGEMLDNGFGRKLRPNPDRAWTQGPALMGQGTARDILMEGMAIRMPLEIQRMTKAIVHDEGVWEVPEQDAEEVSREIERALTFEWQPRDGSGQTMLFEAGCSSPGKRWSDAYRGE